MILSLNTIGLFSLIRFYWENPHPLVSLLRLSIYIQDSEYHGGVPDDILRPRQMVGQYIQLSSPIFCDPIGLIDRVKSSDILH